MLPFQVKSKERPFVHLSRLAGASGVKVYRVPMTPEGYDPGGACWGIRPEKQSLFCLVSGELVSYTYSTSRSSAKNRARGVAPNISFADEEGCRDGR